jgi:hypothetical protein
MLAFSSDVSHWRKQKELVGVSVRTVGIIFVSDTATTESHVFFGKIVTNVVVQLIILLYLIDNNENTSWMILMGSGVGVLIEAWKITKAVDISVGPSDPGATLPYKLIIKGEPVFTASASQTLRAFRRQTCPQ